MKPATITSDNNNIITNKNDDRDTNYPHSSPSPLDAEEPSSPFTTSPPRFEVGSSSSQIVPPPPTWGSRKSIHIYIEMFHRDLVFFLLGNPYAAAMAERTQAMSID